MIKALPAPRQADDSGQAKESKKTFSAAKKDLKSIATLQTQRLYEAMCTERSWDAGDWDRYLLRHPVAGHLVRRLVWVTIADDGPPVIFRPLDDGTLTDSGDSEVELPEDARIRLAHDSVLPPAEIERWTAHLADYEITPLFQQLGRGLYALNPEQRSSRELADFTGHLVETIALRGVVTRLGYARGPIGDGARFDSYEKRFPTLGITAEFHFTGSDLSQENHLVALEGLTFRRETSDGHRAGLTLGDVPGRAGFRVLARHAAAVGGRYRLRSRLEKEDAMRARTAWNVIPRRHHECHRSPVGNGYLPRSRWDTGVVD